MFALVSPNSMHYLFLTEDQSVTSEVTRAVNVLQGVTECTAEDKGHQTPSKGCYRYLYTKLHGLTSLKTVIFYSHIVVRCGPR